MLNIMLLLASGIETNSIILTQGGEKYQSAFYVYEELASAPSTSSAMSIVGQAVAELHLGRLPEAEAALSSAIQKYPDDAELIANTIVLNGLSGKDTAELSSYVQPSLFLCNILYIGCISRNQANSCCTYLDAYNKSNPRTASSPTWRRRVPSLIRLRRNMLLKSLLNTVA